MYFMRIARQNSLLFTLKTSDHEINACLKQKMDCNVYNADCICELPKTFKEPARGNTWFVKQRTRQRPASTELFVHNIAGMDECANADHPIYTAEFCRS